MPRSSKASSVALAVSLFVLVAAGCGKDNATGTEAPLDGGWSGSTSQGKPFHFLVEKNAVVLAMYGFSVVGSVCTDNVTSFIMREPPDAPYPISSGAFTFSTSGSRGTVTVAGDLDKSGSATGTLAVNATVCNGTLPATWTADRMSVAQVNLTGTWTGTLGSSLVADTEGTFTLNQSGTTLTGTYSTLSGGAGTVSGTVLGRVATFNLTQTTAGCTGTFKGHAVVMPSPEVLFFAYTGTDCLGTHANGRGSGTRL